MKPITQTIFADSIPGVFGNCFQTCVASIMELPLEAVPHFMQFKDWPKAFELWLEGLGYSLQFTTDEEELPKDTYFIVGGKSPRGDFDHAVVARNGVIVHDPHPSNAGVLTFIDAIWAVKKEDS